MNQHWIHDRFLHHRLDPQEPLAHSSNDRPFVRDREHRAGVWMRLWARLHWSPSDRQSVTLAVIVYGGLAALWGAKEAGIFSLLAQAFSLNGEP